MFRYTMLFCAAARGAVNLAVAGVQGGRRLSGAQPPGHTDARRRATAIAQNRERTLDSTL